MAYLHRDLAVYRHLYHVRNARIKEDCVKDWEDKAADLVDAAHQHDMNQMYKILQQLSMRPQAVFYWDQRWNEEYVLQIIIFS